jgi:predicted transcriptional regulator
MNQKKREPRRTKSKHASLVRASISFPPALYQGLDTIAQQKKVSLAWVVREAAENYVAAQSSEGAKLTAGGRRKGLR